MLIVSQSIPRPRSGQLSLRDCLRSETPGKEASSWSQLVEQAWDSRHPPLCECGRIVAPRTGVVNKTIIVSSHARLIWRRMLSTTARAFSSGPRFQRSGVHVSTAFYSDDPAVHEDVTQGKGSWQRTVAGIETVLAAGLPPPGRRR